jgi:ferredoxin
MSKIVEKKIGELTVRIDRELCIGSGNCVKVAPDLFELDEEVICAFAPTADSTPPEKIIDACEVCPVQALFVLDKNGREIVP